MQASVPYLYIISCHQFNASPSEIKFRVGQSQCMVFLLSCFQMPALQMLRGWDIGLVELLFSQCSNSLEIHGSWGFSLAGLSSGVNKASLALTNYNSPGMVVSRQLYHYVGFYSPGIGNTQQSIQQRVQVAISLQGLWYYNHLAVPALEAFWRTGKA